MNPSERFLSPKELAAALTEVGLRSHEDYAREIIRQSPLAVRRCLRLSEAIDFLRSNPRFSPFSKKTKSGKTRQDPATRGIRVI